MDVKSVLFGAFGKAVLMRVLCAILLVLGKVADELCRWSDEELDRVYRSRRAVGVPSASERNQDDL